MENSEKMSGRNPLGHLLPALFALFFSCNSTDYDVTPNGLHYRMVVTGEGKKPVIGDRMTLHLSYENAQGQELYNSRILGDDFILELTAPTFRGGIEEGFSMMGEGDSAHFLVPADSMFIRTFNMPIPTTVKSGEQLLFKVKMKSIVSSVEYKSRQRALADSVATADAIAMAQYMTRNNIISEPVRPGVYLIAFEAGRGEAPVAGDSVEVEYTATFLDGSVFDASSRSGTSLKYILGDGTRLKVWDEAISTMRPGAVSRLVLASAEAFGSRGYGPVPPNTPVVYDIKLLRIVRNSVSAASARK